MRREIKFRAWDNINNAFVYSGFPPSFSFWKWYEYSPDSPLMEFSGLTDLNGREIYEGDILTNRDGIKREVYFSEGMFRVTPNTLITYFDVKIGNKFENPELLTEIINTNEKED